MSIKYGRGLGSLTDEQSRVLRAFSKGTCVYPVDCGLDDANTFRVLRELGYSQLVVSEKPYKLTKKGKAVLSELYKQDRREEEERDQLLTSPHG
jgi:hypothetical protein